MNVSVLPLDAGEATNVVQLLPEALAETPELGWGGSFAAISARVCAETEQHTRVELVAKDQEGRLVGCAVLVPDEDLHVGQCLSVMWNYVLPDHRGTIGRQFMRLAVKVAQYWELPVLSYTHRLGVGRYAITYRRLHGKES
jgi:glyceraldehyde-3-phosphate dehydrogenase/erythrose-4-phosphate dehydrogenase